MTDDEDSVFGVEANGARKNTALDIASKRN
jgi:hypothetical protein